MSWKSIVVQLLVVTSFAHAQTNAGRAVYVGDDLLKNYNPTPTLITRETHVDKPKFPAVDIHCHWLFAQHADVLLKSMDDTGVRTAVNLSGGFGHDLDRMLAQFHRVAPDRLLIFCNLDFSRIDESDFGQHMADYLRDAHVKGASGLKVFKSFGLNNRDKSGKLLPVDDPRLDPAWDACAELHMPVLIHSGDPPAFFQPTDEHNERWMQIKRHPDWSFYGPQYPTYDAVLGQFIHMIEKHPKTIFVSAHLINSGDDLPKLSRWLDTHPNLYTDLSGRIEELGRQPYSARKFLIKYQDRILFGTDRYPGRRDQPRNAIYYRFLETDDEYFNYYDAPFPPEGDWKIDGMYLPDEVLKKIYSTNAGRALKGLMPEEPRTK